MARKMDVTQLRDEFVQAFEQGDEDRARGLLPQFGTGPGQVRSMLKDPDSLIRQAAALGLGELGGAASARRLEEQLAFEEARRDHDGEAVVEDITRALGRIKEASAYPILTLAEVFLDAAQALRKFQPTSPKR